MKTSLDHLPEHKRDELCAVGDFLREQNGVEMVILFGSHARGDWVEEKADDGVHYKYQSDYDLLVVVKDAALADRSGHWLKVERDARRLVHTPVTLIAHDIDFVNRRLRKGQYFFSDIKKEGVLLFDSGRFQLAEAKELTPAERRKLAEEDFDYWMSRVEPILETYGFTVERDARLAAFLLHQATESLYAAILLVFSRYKPSTHDLETLGKQVAALEPRFLEVFPLGTTEERQRFELLRKAYVDARYKPSYQISREELEWLAARVQHLRALAGQLCRERIDSFSPGMP
jgi:predicted nucleotidyltransferase/HEPN domain-containing protein